MLEKIKKMFSGSTNHSVTKEDFAELAYEMAKSGNYAMAEVLYNGARELERKEKL